MALCCDSVSCFKPHGLTGKEEDDGTLFHEKNGKKTYVGPGKFVQPLGSMETLMAVGGLYGTFNTVQAIWLKSKTPFREDTVKKAIEILARQIPHLQLCLGRRGYRLWFRRVKKLLVDFEMCSADIMEVYESLMESKYNMWSGPLWKVKMVIPSGNNNNGNEKEFTAALIFSAQHCITDGFTNMTMCREVVQILNQLAAGKEVLPSPIPLSPTVEKTIERVSPASFIVKYFCKKFTATMIKNFYHKSSFQGVLPVPEPVNNRTRVLHTELSVGETGILLKLCKIANITVHSCIVTLTNFALLKLVQSKSSEPIGRAAIIITHCVNMRRYLPDEYKNASGCHISLAEEKNRLSLGSTNDFWNQAKNVHISLKENLEVIKKPLKVIPLLQVASMIFPANVFLTKRGCKNKTDCHYVTTNMGNLKALLPASSENDDVKITSVLRSVSSNYGGNPFLLTFHTFGDKFMLSIDYCTTKMTDDIAKELFENICTFLRNLVESGTLHV